MTIGPHIPATSSKVGVNIILYHSPPWHPQSNGVAEHHVQDVKAMLKRIFREEVNPNWATIVKIVQNRIKFAQCTQL